MPYRNTAVTVPYVAWDTANNVGKTGDGANHTLRGVGDGTEFTPSAPSITEVDATNLPGVYKASLTSGENNYAFVLLGGKSSTANIVIIPISWSNEASADAVKISGSSTAADNVEANIGNLNATVSSRSSHAAADVAALVLVTPANKLATDGSGRVTVGSNADKTGYSLTQAFPANFSALSITAGGLVDITQAAADKAWGTASRTLTAATNITSNGAAIDQAKIANLDAAVSSRSTLTAAQVNAEVADVFKVDVIAEPAQGAPPATPTFEQAQAYLYFNWRNEHRTTLTEENFYDNAGTTKLVKRTISDDGTTNIKGKVGSGA